MTNSNIATIVTELSTSDLMASMQTTGFFDDLIKEDTLLQDIDMTFHPEMRDYAILVNQKIGFEKYNVSTL